MNSPLEQLDYEDGPLTQDSSHVELADLTDPDPNYLLATEREDPVQAQRSALGVIVSDYRSETVDSIGYLLTELLAEAGFAVDGVLRVASNKTQIRQAIETAVVGGVDLVVTVGGTGVGARDKTPEATRAVLDQVVPGVSQALRASGLICGATEACTSRGIAGVSGQTVVVNLADTRAAVRDGLATIPPLVHHLIDELQFSSMANDDREA
ncbi:molybdenum cofactor biosynthesis protein [Corynebacterium atypicum]|uniref:Molybdenum cofactor biosynthesis protein n=1 Tax=Corynebacterium atypicum TaxID=191610 RepID=A0ABN4DF50_9CORY|nr:molybdopterin-binding protein [Corynebacterium atypicum]AIG63862.1 molybdenum cofactor biosynthesis protein [Corynebacterium atypicum]